jgi:TM2 domain-containing membrane protein YozV
MFIMKRITSLLALFAAFFLLSSFVNTKPTTSVNPSVKIDKVNALIKVASADGKISFKELKGIVAEMKGSKLSFPEKVALKLNEKKVSKNIMASNSGGGGGKSQLTAVLLCFFLGGLGIHRFYLGYTWQGIVQLLTLGGLGIWTIIDFIRILTGSLQPKNGEYAKTLGGN